MIGVDLGSNTIRAVEIDCETKQRVKEYQKVVGLAKGLKKGEDIKADSERVLFEALEEIVEMFDFSSKNHKCITTEAMRIAKNSAKILNKIKDRFGLNFEIIDGKEEARYTLMGVKEALGLESDFCMFDLGGASTEISYMIDGRFETKSFPFGILNTASKYEDNILEGIQKEVKTVEEFTKEKNVSKLIATAGTPTTVCAYLQDMDYESYNYKKINGKTLHVRDYKRAYEEILSMPLSEQERYCGIRRSELIRVGILMVIEIMGVLGFDESIVSDDGLREGLAISLCKQEELNG